MKRRTPWEHKSGLLTFWLHEDIKGKTLTWALNPIKEESDIEAVGPSFSSIFPEDLFAWDPLDWKFLWGERLLFVVSNIWATSQHRPVFLWYNVFKDPGVVLITLAKSDLYVKSSEVLWTTGPKPWGLLSVVELPEQVTESLILRVWLRVVYSLTYYFSKNQGSQVEYF